MNRRKFLTVAGLSVVSVQFLQVENSNAITRHPYARAFEPFLSEPDNALVISSECYLLVPHNHRLLIPFEALTNPPEEGIKLNTELSIGFHFHSVQITQEELRKVADGEIVTVVDGTVGEHVFTLFLEGGISKVD